MRKRPRGYQAFAECATACQQGLPKTSRAYMKDRYLGNWWDHNTFREANLMAQRKHGNARQ
jgi:hypothetical protein